MIRPIRPDEILDIDIDAPAVETPPEAKAPVSPASTGAGGERTNCTRRAGRLRGFVNVRRDLEAGIRLADAAIKADGEPDFEPLRRAASLNTKFRAHFNLNLLNAEVSALANPLLRRGDIQQLRQLSRRIQLREVVEAELSDAGRQPEVNDGCRN